MKEKILHLRKQGLSYNEIVKKLGCGKSTVYYHCGEIPIKKRLMPKKRHRNVNKERARKLRLSGIAIKQISKKLHIPLSTVSMWVRDIILTKEQRTNIDKQSKQIHSKRMRKYALHHIKTQREKRLASQKEGRIKASTKDWRHAFACGLFYGEGSKLRGTVNITNCDVKLLKFFVEFMKDTFMLKGKDFKFRVTYFKNGIPIDKIHKYWSRQLGIPYKNANKSYMRINKNTKIKYPYGICSVLVHNTLISQHLWGAINEYIGDKKHRWLN